MLCPQCNEKATRKGGGATINAGRICYYHCPDCNTDFSVTGQTVKVLDHEPELPFRNRREALHSLYRAVKDDREWFGAVTEETSELGRAIFRQYLVNNKRKAEPRRQSISFGFARRKAAV